MFGKLRKALESIDRFVGSLPRKATQSIKLLKPKASVSGFNVSGQTGGGKWPFGMSSSGSATVINTAETLQNARSVWHQSPQARTLINRRRDITVDKGLPIEPQPNWEALGITDEDFKEKWIRDHEVRFDQYMSSKQCHRSRTMTGYQIQRFWSLCDGRDNDQFGRFFYSGSRALVNPLQFEFVDPSNIVGCSFVDSVGWQDWTDGIKRNDKGEEISYKVRVKKKSQKGWKWENIEITAKGSRSGRIFMIHGFEAEYAGQGRGFSPLHFAVQNLENIVDFTSGTTKKAINQADLVGFIKPSDDAAASNPFEQGQGDLIPSGTEAGTVTDDETAAEFCFRTPEYNTKVPGSDFIANLAPGEDIEFLKDTAPNTQFDNFITSVMSWLSSAYNLPIEVVLMKFNANYSASRAALLMAWQIGRIKQDDLKADLMDSWWEMWLSEEIAAGRTQAPGWSDPVLKQAWSRYKLQGPPLPSIDPAKDLAAIEKKLKLHLSTQNREARAINGSDANQNIETNRKMFEKSPPAFWEDEPESAEERIEANEPESDDQEDRNDE